MESSERTYRTTLITLGVRYKLAARSATAYRVVSVFCPREDF